MIGGYQIGESIGPDVLEFADGALAVGVDGKGDSPFRVLIFLHILLNLYGIEFYLILSYN